MEKMNLLFSALDQAERTSYFLSHAVESENNSEFNEKLDSIWGKAIELSCSIRDALTDSAGDWNTVVDAYIDFICDSGVEKTREALLNGQR